MRARNACEAVRIVVWGGVSDFKAWILMLDVFGTVPAIGEWLV